MFRCMKIFIIIIIISILYACPNGFVENPQYTGGNNQDECYPAEFVYYSSIAQGFYLFLEVLINDYEISSEDWVGAFNGEICVGARNWGTCGGNSACDVPVLGDDSSELCEGYMIQGGIPSFKIYDTSEGTYIDATSSSYPTWYTNMAVPIDQLYANIMIDGCTVESACNFNPYATNDDGSCEYFSCNANYWDQNGDGVLDNFNDFEHNGSLTSTILLESQSYAQNGDMLAAFVDGELRGVAQTTSPPFGPYVGTYMFQMMIYSNEINDETLNFYYFDQSLDEIFALNETLAWVSNMVEGDVIDPFIFNLDSQWLGFENILPEYFSITNIYPNPFNPSITIQFSIPEVTSITFKFYDTAGRLVDAIDYGAVTIGNYDLLWSPDNIASGTYLITMSDGKNMHKKKATYIK